MAGEIQKRSEDPLSLEKRSVPPFLDYCCIPMDRYTPTSRVGCVNIFDVGMTTLFADHLSIESTSQL